tara:strand:- start:10845 stop:11360 length:516 start_codon:yes stop_codon:yes gene_type:complete
VFSRQFGLSAIEILMGFIIAGILITLGVPSYQFYRQNQRAATLSSDFVKALAYTRSEAVKRGTPVTMCAAGNAGFTSCGNAGNWGDGWIIFADPDGDGNIANQNDRLMTHAALRQGASITTTQPRITYAGSGFINAGAGVYNLTATGCTGNHGRQVSIANTGRATVTEVAC